MKIGHIYTHEDSIVKLTSVWKKGKEGNVEWEYKGRGEFVQDTLCTCKKLSQWNPLMLMYENQKLKLKSVYKVFIF
jgi:hypothetical protein